MLSRVADSLYWMSRYLERAEHTARMLDVGLNMMLDQSPERTEQRWQRLLASLHTRPPANEGDNLAYAITQALTFDLSSSTSIVACIAAARENARQVREQISSEMWEQLNQLFLSVKSTTIDNIWVMPPWEFFQSIKDGLHLFQGITDSTMNHNEGWLFIEVGYFLERVRSLATLLDVHFGAFQDRAVTSDDDYLEWVGLLKSCTAFEAYCKVYTADLRPDRIAEFLLLNNEFPHSVCYSVDMVQNALASIAEATETHKSGRVNRLSGRLRAAVSFGQIDEIMSSGLHAYLEDIRRQCDQLHESIQQTYIVYPIESALVG